jgi:gamma-glutamyltranspeptidase/glutathione hydrolase
MILRLLMILLLSGLPQLIFAGQFKPVSGKNGMVASADELASRIGVEILQQGGNAIDAAVAVGFALAVTYPQAGNIGGGGFMIIRTSDNEVRALDYREKAPAAGGRDMYLDDDGNVIENASLVGYLASGVPGSVAGLWQAHREYGQLDWAELVGPAIKLARDGYELNRYKEASLGWHFENFQKFPATMAVLSKAGERFREGDLFIQTDLAHTLERIRDNGRDGFYRGETARLIAADMAENGGLITEDDLAEYYAIWREPVQISYRGYDIFSMPPPSSGGIVMAEILNILQDYDLAQLGHNSSNSMHLWVEAERIAYADRAEYLGDSDFIPVPMERLISGSYAEEMRKRIDPYRAGESVVKTVNAAEHTETTHFSIVDRWGNAVSNTTTLNGSYGSCVVISGTGVIMNNEMDDFSIKPGHPNMYGLLGNEANAIEPGKRMLSSMTPSIITKDDSLYMLVGSPGGSTIITTVAQVISNVIDHRMNIRSAVEAGRFHHQWLPDSVFVEARRFPFDVQANLQNMGHKLKTIGSIGDVHAILWNRRHHEWAGWSDPRGNGTAIGY